ncbi:MAG: hypothetical protein ACK4SY_06180 [Pyrobaculum sp.]
MLEILQSTFLVETRGVVCTTSIGDFHVAVVESGAVYAMRCREGGSCRDCVEFSIDDVAIYIPRHMYHCLACILGELFNAGLLNLSIGGSVVIQRRAYVVPPMAKERGDPERLVKRARGILENYILKLLVEVLPACCSSTWPPPRG